MSEGMSDLDSIANVIWFTPSEPLHTFLDMWYHIFLWAFFSCILIHTIAALVAFCTLRKHKVGRFFPIFVLAMGFLTPVTSGLVTSSVIAFVYRASAIQMPTFYAFLYGVGQTAVAAAFSFSRVLATL